MNKLGPVGPTFIIDLKLDILGFSKEAIKHVYGGPCLPFNLKKKFFQIVAHACHSIFLKQFSDFPFFPEKKNLEFFYPISTIFLLEYLKKFFSITFEREKF